MNNELGTSVTTCGIVFRVAPALPKAQALVHDLIDGIGMTAAYASVHWDFPMTPYKKDRPAGGNGFTLVQSLVESFLVIDSWPDLGAAYLFISSCKPFLIEDVYAILEEHAYRIGEHFSEELSIVPTEP